MAEITDPQTRQMGVDDLLMQVLGMFRSSRKAVDELLTARFQEFDVDESEDLSFDEFAELIVSVDAVSASLRPASTIPFLINIGVYIAGWDGHTRRDAAHVSRSV